jgi:hypothetical protein
LGPRGGKESSETGAPRIEVGMEFAITDAGSDSCMWSFSERMVAV